MAALYILLPLALVLALLVCLIPTTIGGLLSAIGIAGMDRMIQANLIAMSGRAVEAAGDVDVLLLDKTGTITLGNRQATAFIPANGNDPRELAGQRAAAGGRRPWPAWRPAGARGAAHGPGHAHRMDRGGGRDTEEDSPAGDRSRSAGLDTAAGRAAGAETATLSGQRASETMLEYAHTRNVTKIVVGKPARPRWKRDGLWLDRG